MNALGVYMEADQYDVGRVIEKIGWVIREVKR
jgi:hypothetical protein